MENGELRHEKCRHGTLTTAFKVKVLSAEGGEPTVIPLCLWQPPENAPPAIRRSWGGAIEFDRDCAVCKAFEAL